MSEGEMTLCVWCMEEKPSEEFSMIPGTDVLLCATCMVRYNSGEGGP